MRDHADDVLRFTIDSNVPFSNNLAEQAIRMPKVKQKVSGYFRTPEGAHAFCTIRSYLATIQKQARLQPLPVPRSGFQRQRPSAPLLRLTFADYF